MNRVLYQLSYAAMCGQRISGTAEISFIIISNPPHFVKKNFWNFGNNLSEVIFLKIWKKAMLFYLGGMGYVGLELLWRQRSHSSMFVLGGLCFLVLGKLDEVRPRLSLPLRIVTGAGVITILELAAGLLVNRRHQVWDYSALPGNFLGQICLPFSLLWIPVSALAMWLHGRLSHVLVQSTTSL